jgi:hypothetical protein
MAKSPDYYKRSDPGAEDERNGIVETQYLLRSPINAARLLASIEEADDGLLICHALSDGANGRR